MRIFSEHFLKLQKCIKIKKSVIEEKFLQGLQLFLLYFEYYIFCKNEVGANKVRHAVHSVISFPKKRFYGL